MKRDCTDIFLKYREIARLVWNAGFWTNPQLWDWNSVFLYREVTARLFEGMVLLALGYEGRIEDANCPGQIARFYVIAQRAGVKLLVDKNTPTGPGHIFGVPAIPLPSESEAYELKFLRYFDWD